ncbi:hypothetical protein [Amycolatopsis sp. SID8362]|uniref:hypothetical protein n=1 Tax=Amycolatopsis sp. SID8362 TaxID=2690346 RepID=UPI00136D4FB3|nr:hypothetical protein [Amycolatopsis sp. SID8362]NBH09517.1 hypothetical protein [Amycolatopsis sp. SID8362]NED46209.1 hypothetical protein [Amycolatopsis sp. SID8362]
MEALPVGRIEVGGTPTGAVAGEQFLDRRRSGEPADGAAGELEASADFLGSESLVEKGVHRSVSFAGPHCPPIRALLRRSGPAAQHIAFRLICSSSSCGVDAAGSAWRC